MSKSNGSGVLAWLPINFEDGAITVYVRTVVGRTDYAEVCR